MSEDILFVNLDAALSAIRVFDGSPTDFKLPISNELNDATGITMAIITDAILGRGWVPDGFDEGPGFRTFKYRLMT